MAKPFRFAARARSFHYAGVGLRTVLFTQHNAWIHAAATVAVGVAGGVCRLAPAEWCWVVLAVAGVWTAEAFNTALELLADAVSPAPHPLVGTAKDCAAAAVLMAATGAGVIGFLVFAPRVIALWRG